MKPTILGMALATFGLTVCGAALAQGSGANIVGIWTAQTPGQGGMVHGADQYLPDGSYVSVMQLPNGSVQRIWGSYEVRQAGPRQIHVSYNVRGFLPQQICAQAPGFAVKCTPNKVPPTSELDADVLSSSALRVNGITLSRANGSPLLQMRPPAQLVLAARAPVQPRIQQPIAPNPPGHYTPTGPGSVQGIQSDTDQQQYRICAVNGGQVVIERNGRPRCVS